MGKRLQRQPVFIHSRVVEKNGFINRAIKEAIERDIASAGDTAKKECAANDKIKTAIDQLLAKEEAAEE